LRKKQSLPEDLALRFSSRRNIGIELLVAFSRKHAAR
jgi:hypothetical protein